MSETYCGKSCDTCDYMSSGKCPGCGEGPGHTEYGACDLAKCCRNKGHEKCESCKFNYDCYLLKDKEFMPEEMAKKTKNELFRRDRMEKIIPLLGYWIGILFWIKVANLVGLVFNNMPGLAFIGLAIILGCQVAYGVILLKISSAESRYKLAGILLLVSVVTTISVLFIPGVTPILAQLINLISTIISTVSIYYEISAHSEVLKDHNNMISREWMIVWQGTIASLALSICAGFLASAVYGIAVIMQLAASIISMGVAVLFFVYLYKTAQVFKTKEKTTEE